MARQEPKIPLDVIIIGGSLAGLLHGVVLTRLGHNVHILEKSPTNFREQQGGAGIIIGADSAKFLARFDASEQRINLQTKTFQYFGANGSVTEKRKFPNHMSSWAIFYYRLRWLFDGLTSTANPLARVMGSGEGKATVQLDATVQSVRPLDDDPTGKMNVTYITSGNEKPTTILADLVLDASGFGSAIRKAVLPDCPVSYVGVLATRGTIPETSVADSTRAQFDERSGYSFNFTIRDGHWAIGFLIPGTTGSTVPGERLINFVWHRPVERDGELWKQLMTDKHGVLRRSTMPVGCVSDAAWQSCINDAEERLDPLFADLVKSTEQPFLTAINESLPSHISFFNIRLLLVGEAACLTPPWGAAAVGQSAISAFALERVMRGEIGMEEWEKEVLGSGGRTAARCSSFQREYLVEKRIEVNGTTLRGNRADSVINLPI
jgi:2-polyprenyl-6-methoxyphenol hydroxylase-like FAD-dependent oxidoreductase